MYKHTPEPKIPIPVAVGIIIILIIAVSFIIPKKKTSQTNPAVEKITFLEITNKTPHSANVIVCLQQKDQLTLHFGTDLEKLNATVHDDRDVEKTPQVRSCHYFTLTKLLPETDYYMKFSLSTGLLASNKIFRLVTPTKLNYITIDPLYGKITTESAKPIENAILLARFNELPTISARISNGEWLLPLHYLEKIPSENTPFKIEIITHDDKRMEFSGVYKYKDQLKKTLVFGKTYSFAYPELQTTPMVTPATEGKKQHISIIYPKSNTVIPSFRPLFKGLALPDKKVTITLEQLKSASKKTGTVIATFQTTAKKDGVWTVEPTSNIAPSRYRLTMTTQEENGRSTKIARIFQIQKSGEAVLGEATGSATLTPTAIPTTAPTNTPIPTPTTQPTSVPTVAPSLPETGIPETTVSVLSFALIAIGITLFIAFR